MQAWGDEVAGVDLPAGRRRFARDVVAFGTRADVVAGLDQLYDDQWSRVWPSIEGFRFVLDQLDLIVSPDRLLAVAVVPWDSVGFHPDGSRFDRPGRATIVLQRASPDAAWFGVHTHFSLAHGVPPTSHRTARP